MDEDTLSSDPVEQLPFLSADKDHLLGIADALPDAAAPGEVLRAMDGDVDSAFMKWWVPEQLGWQQRAEAVYAEILTKHPLSDKPFPDAVFPEWYGEWWAIVLSFPWAARLGEAVESAEAWISEH